MPSPSVAAPPDLLASPRAPRRSFGVALVLIALWASPAAAYDFEPGWYLLPGIELGMTTGEGEGEGGRFGVEVSGNDFGRIPDIVHVGAVASATWLTTDGVGVLTAGVQGGWNWFGVEVAARVDTAGWVGARWRGYRTAGFASVFVGRSGGPTPLVEMGFLIKPICWWTY